MMMRRRAAWAWATRALAASLCALLLTAAAEPPLPGWDKGEQVFVGWGEVMTSGIARDVRWDEDWVYWRQGDQWRRVARNGGDPMDVEEAEVPAREEAAGERRGRRGGAPARGRQADRAISPDGTSTAICDGHNIRIEREGETPRAVTTDGAGGLKYGTASWVYGEELNQNTAMWWSPDGQTLAYYRFDERDVPPYFLLAGNTRLRTEVLSECYPKPGDPNPKASLMAYSMAEGSSRAVDTGDWEYTYGVSFSPSGRELLFHRTNRHQDVLELCAWDLATGTTRVVAHEEAPTWQENLPEMRFLEDGRRFLWATERTGFKHYELRSLDGAEPITLTTGEFPFLRIEHLDEKHGNLWAAARSSEIRINDQFWRVKLDGSGQQRMTPFDRHHKRLQVSPEGTGFVCTDESIAIPPSTRLYDAGGNPLATLAEGVKDPWTPRGLTPPELVDCLAGDGKTPIYAVVRKPSGYDPSRQYPMVVHVYGGPAIASFDGSCVGPDPRCELGFITMKAENRGTGGHGRAFETATYLKLGQVDLDDQAAAVADVCRFFPVDRTRVGIIGSSYGGYMSALALLRHPETFAVGVAESAVTDWRNYDSIYTERYMRTPEENAEGYNKGSCVELAEQLKGSLFLVHGMADDNVHPANAWQFANALQKEDIDFEMMFFPTAGHGVGGIFAEREMWGFLVEHLRAAP